MSTFLHGESPLPKVLLVKEERVLTPFILHGRDPLALSAARSSHKTWTSELFWVKPIQGGLTELPGSGGLCL